MAVLRFGIVGWVQSYIVRPIALHICVFIIPTCLGVVLEVIGKELPGMTWRFSGTRISGCIVSVINSGLSPSLQSRNSF